MNTEIPFLRKRGGILWPWGGLILLYLIGPLLDSENEQNQKGGLIAVKILKRFLLFVAIPSVFALVVGGYDGDGGGSGDGGITYTDITAQPTIDDTNAVDLSLGVYQCGEIGMSVETVGAVQTADYKQIGHSRVLKLAQTTEEAILQVDESPSSGVVVSGTVVTESDTIPGDCGGNAYYNIEFDDVTGAFSGTMNFNDYCSEGVTLSGSTSFSGTFDVDTKVFL